MRELHISNGHTSKVGVPSFFWIQRKEVTGVWRNMMRRVRWDRHAARTGEIRWEYKPEEKKPLARPRSRR
jgi:hypothetical protein